MVVKNRRNDDLYSEIFLSENSQNVVIICHGLLCNKDFGMYPSLAQHIIEEIGVSVLRFNFSGTPPSGGCWGVNRFEEEVDDIEDIVAYSVDVLGLRVIAIIGHSKGANEVLMHAGRYRTVSKVVCIAPRFFPK